MTNFVRAKRLTDHLERKGFRVTATGLVLLNCGNEVHSSAVNIT